MTLTLLFYTLSERFNDDERLIAFFIDEANADKIYRHLLKGHFDRYAIMLQDKLNQFDGDLSEWIADTSSLNSLNKKAYAVSKPCLVIIVFPPINSV